MDMDGIRSASAQQSHKAYRSPCVVKQPATEFAGEPEHGAKPELPGEKRVETGNQLGHSLDPGSAGRFGDEIDAMASLGKPSHPRDDMHALGITNGADRQRPATAFIRRTRRYGERRTCFRGLQGAARDGFKPQHSISTDCRRTVDATAPASAGQKSCSSSRRDRRSAGPAIHPLPSADRDRAL
jgi:hypothetical protein